ncbi:P-loop NTPase fold protein [Mesorhizobium sp. M0491]|uniref:P-loop NTPase fold protein n=1 Tax=Mesorhizobium sp. M0491 TaxID=2956950 RepID=UPI00333935A9
MPSVTVRHVDEDVGARIEPPLAALFAQASGLGDIVLSPHFAHILLESVRYLPQKEAARDVLSTSTVFLVTLLLARRLATLGPGDEGDPLRDELDGLRRWGALVLKDFSSQLDAAAADFFVTAPEPDVEEFVAIAPTTAVNGVQLGPGLLRAVEALADMQEIEVTDFVLRSLDDPKSGVSSRIAVWRMQDLVEVMKSVVKTRAGRIPKMVREAADEELSLFVRDYAKALATILRSAEDEFTFALFGPWGSGKTTLTRLLTPLLESPGHFGRAIPGAMGQEFAKLRYEVACHNAWKYRQPPEAWVYLYKSLVERAGASAGALGRLALAARASHFRHGPWPLVGALLALALLGIPLSQTLQLATILGSLIGTSALAHLAAITPRVQTKVRAIFEKNARLSTGPERLGLLALVGEDVKALLSAWTTEPPVVPSRPDPRGELPPASREAKSAQSKRLWLPILILAVVAAGWAYGLMFPPQQHGGSFLVRSVEAVAHLLRAGLGDKISIVGFEMSNTDNAVGWDNDQTGSWILWAAWVGIALATVVGPWLLAGSRPQRVLLIVDDLDRCAPGEMLTVIENMKLLVDDPVIGNRLQVLMLVDERVLAHAIETRYRDIIVERAAGVVGETEENAKLLARQEVVAEQNEKLFACHLRFPALTDRDVADLVVSLSSRELKEIRERERRAAQVRQEEALGKAERDLENAKAAERSARSTVELVRAGQRRGTVDVEAPSETPVPLSLRRVGLADAVIPAKPEEKATRMRQNAANDEFNRRLAAMTPEARLAQNPDVVRRHDQTVAIAKQMEERLERLRSGASVSAETRQAEAQPAPFGEGDVRFTPEEVGELERLVPGYFRSVGRRPSPRAVRTLLFKIQLFRLLLQVRTPWQPLESFSIVSILDAFKQAAQVTPTATQDEETVAFASQVI